MLSDDGDDHHLLPDIHMHNNGYDRKQMWHAINIFIFKKEKVVREEKVMVYSNWNYLNCLKTLIHFSSAAMESTIYVFGGYLNIPVDPSLPYQPNPCLNKVYYIDMDVQNPEWEGGPSMILGSHNHYSFSNEGKLYVLSGHSFFSPVDEHPMKVGKSLLVQKPMMAQLTKQSLDVQLWTVIPGRRFCSMPSCRKIYKTGILFYLNDADKQQIYAFDVNEPGSEHKRVIFDQKRRNCLPYRRSWDESAFPSSFFLSLGNKNLVVIWAHEHYSGSDPLLRVHCSIHEV